MSINGMDWYFFGSDLDYGLLWDCVVNFFVGIRM